METIVSWVANLADYLSKQSNLFVSIAAIVASIVAIVGLRTWRMELRGKNNYKTAIQIKRAAYVLKLLMDDRLFVGSQYAMAVSLYPEKKAELFADILERHLELIKQSLDRLKREMLNGQVLWGMDFIEVIRPIQASVMKLVLAGSDFKFGITERGLSQEKRFGSAEALLLGGDIVISREFDAQTDKAMQLIDGSLKKYLG